MEQGSLEMIAAVLGGLASIGAFVKFVWPAIKRGCDRMLGNTLIHKKIDRLSDCVEELTNEMITNAGTSMKDSMLRLERNVALTSERQRARMLDSPELVYETDLEGNCTWVNRTYSRAVQRGHDELMGKGWLNVIAESSRDEVDEKWYESVQQNREFEMSIMYQTPDGDKFPVMVRSYKMKHNGETIGFLGTVTLL